jgi:predicted amino acid-binding ACT domain protein
MNVSLVLTVIGDDRPGLVEQLATVISQHQGNWLESSMSNLSGKFAGIVCVSVADAHLAGAFRSARGFARPARQLSRSPDLPAAQAGCHPTAEAVARRPRPHRHRPRGLAGARPACAINVEDLSTHTASAPMSAGILFHASGRADRFVSSRCERTDPRAREQLSNDLMVDITLDETART